MKNLKTIATCLFLLVLTNSVQAQNRRELTYTRSIGISADITVGKTADTITLTFEDVTDGSEFQVVDVTGKILQKGIIKKAKAAIIFIDYKSSNYIVNVIDVIKKKPVKNFRMVVTDTNISIEPLVATVAPIKKNVAE